MKTARSFAALALVALGVSCDNDVPGATPSNTPSPRLILDKVLTVKDDAWSETAADLAGDPEKDVVELTVDMNVTTGGPVDLTTPWSAQDATCIRTGIEITPLPGERLAGESGTKVYPALTASNVTRHRATTVVKAGRIFFFLREGSKRNSWTSADTATVSLKVYAK